MLKFVNDILLVYDQLHKVDYILYFTNPTYKVLKRTNTKTLHLHLVYEMWDFDG